jgi:hypothetical protein
MLDIEMSKTGDSHPSENSANGIEEVTGCCARAESTRKASLAASRFNCENLFHRLGCAFVNLDSVPWSSRALLLVLPFPVTFLLVRFMRLIQSPKADRLAVT